MGGALCARHEDGGGRAGRPSHGRRAGSAASARGLVVDDGVTVMLGPPWATTTVGACWRVAGGEHRDDGTYRRRTCAPAKRTPGGAVTVLTDAATGVRPTGHRTRGGRPTMVTRLSASDASFYQRENTSTPMYVGSLSILRKPRGGLSYETLLATVERRLPQVPRYRQKVREVTLGLARPVWIDDRDFDITYHIRRSALPSPGSDAQLHELVARLGLAATGQVPAAMGDVSGRGAGQEPRRHLHQVASGTGQRDVGTGDRSRDRRPDPAAAGVR